MLQLILTLALLASVTVLAQEHPWAEIMHYWVSSGEQAALRVLQHQFEADGGQWVTTPLPNQNKMRGAMISRVAEGLPPTLMQWHAGNNIVELAELDLVADIESIAQRQNWHHIMPKVVLDSVTHKGRFIVVPVNIHGENWAWYNRSIYRHLKLAYPRNWDEFLVQAPRIKAAGYLPLAIGASGWQLRILFTDILIGIGGRKAYLQLITSNRTTLNPTILLQTMQILGALRQYSPPDGAELRWDEATRLVINGQAAVQFMGDWAKSEFLAAGKIVGQDFDCHLAPGNEMVYVTVIDAFAFAKTIDPRQQAAQRLIAKHILSPKIQRAFSLAKGSVPVNKNVDMAGFDRCAQIGIKSIRDDNAAVPAPSLVAAFVQSGVLDVHLTNFWHDLALTPEQAVQQLMTDLQEK
ncbi:MAG: carbohydrate ABC transporter substrate-binding protein [Candidatus Competibacteraceae bacterium]|nr:carbohydrate ABC transporter substrate-binding protein [Candidatus Competibacteraceae bacterium]